MCDTVIKLVAGSVEDVARDEVATIGDLPWHRGIDEGGLSCANSRGQRNYPVRKDPVP